MTDDRERLRAFFREHGWSIHMDDREGQPTDPFEVLAAAQPREADPEGLRAALDKAWAHIDAKVESMSPLYRDGWLDALDAIRNDPAIAAADAVVAEYRRALAPPAEPAGLREALEEAIGTTDASEGLPHYHVADGKEGVFVERQAVLDIIDRLVRS